MDSKAFCDMANRVSEWKMTIDFNIASSLLSVLAVRQEFGANAQTFSRRRPLACWILTMLVIFSGSMITNGLLNEPIVSPFKNTPQLLVGTAMWYLVFYAPNDIGYKIAKFLPVQIAASAMKELYRVNKVYDGVLHAAHLYPNAWIIMIIIGTIRGSGDGFIKLLIRFYFGARPPTATEFMQPSFFTKGSLLASIVFVLDHNDWISAPHGVVYLGILTFFLYFKITSIFSDIHDPFVPIENFFCALFLDQISDGLINNLEEHH